MVMNCEITPIRRPTISSSLLCALKNNLEEAITPANKINTLIEKVKFISKCILRLIKYIIKLPIPSICMLPLNFTNNINK